jgi:hypothetical protein
MSQAIGIAVIAVIARERRDRKIFWAANERKPRESANS